jgi:hypothetical protein
MAIAAHSHPGNNRRVREDQQDFKILKSSNSHINDQAIVSASTAVIRLISATSLCRGFDQQNSEV